MLKKSKKLEEYARERIDNSPLNVNRTLLSDKLIKFDGGSKPLPEIIIYKNAPLKPEPDSRSSANGKEKSK